MTSVTSAKDQSRSATALARATTVLAKIVLVATALVKTALVKDYLCLPWSSFIDIGNIG